MALCPSGGGLGCGVAAALAAYKSGALMVSRMNAGMMEPKVAEVMKSASLKLDESIARALAKSGD